MHFAQKSFDISKKSTKKTNIKTDFVNITILTAPYCLYAVQNKKTDS